MPTVHASPPVYADNPLLVWRRHTLYLLFRISLLLIVPVVLINAATQIWLGRWQFSLFQTSIIGALIGLSLLRPADDLLRGKAIVGIFLINCLTNLYYLGNYSITLGLMFVVAVLAALLLNLRDVIGVLIVGLGGVIALLIGFGAGVLPYPTEPVQYVTTWPVILNTICLTTSISVMLVVMIRSLVSGLQASFQATQTTLAELEHVKGALETTVATQLRYAEGLANCSRILLTAGSDAPDWEPVVQQAIGTLRKAVDCSAMGFHLFPHAEGRFPHAVHTISDYDPEVLTLIAPPALEADMAPNLREAVRRGELVSGTRETLFPPPSSASMHLAANQLQAFLVGGVHIGGIWRGYLIAGTTDARPHWDEPTQRLIRTGLEMITIFLQQWETAQTIRSQEAQLRAVGDNLPNGFIYQYRLDAEQRPSFTYLTGGVTQVLGVTPEEGLADASALNNLIAPEDQERSLQAVLTSRAQMSVFSDVLRYIRADGGERWLYISARPRPADQESVFWDGVALDISDRQRAAAELARARDAAEAATRAKSAFLANMSHEIRTPLNAVIGMTELLKDTQLTEEQEALVDTIHTGGQALLAVISDILDFSRIESGHGELEVQPFDLHTCLKATLDLVGHSARQKGLAVGYTILPSLPRIVVGDESRLRQVLLNLLGNAVKFTAQGSITLIAEGELQPDQTTQVKISVRDTGIGLQPDQVEQIFEPFVQADRSTARRYGGTGLGLAISRQIITLMAGTITAVSNPGTGSTFTIRAPFQVARETDLSPPPAPEAVPTRSLQVLVAEDNPVNQEVIRRMVARLGHNVTLVADGHAAVEAVGADRYDVILMDMHMPVLDGESATRRIRALQLAQPRIIALTASALPDERERALAAGMDDYLSKPVVPAVLQRALQAVPTNHQEHSADGVTSAGAAPPPLIDWSQLYSLFGALDLTEAEVLTMTRELLEATVPAQLDALDAAVAANDNAACRAVLHQLRGGCVQVAAQAMVDLCLHLEQATPGDRPALAADLRACYHQTLAALQARLAEI